MAFKELSNKINLELLRSNFETIRRDYLSCKDDDFFDFLTDDESLSEMEFFLEKAKAGKKNNNHWWQIIPLIWNNKVFTGNPDYIKYSDTINILLNLGIKPVMAVYSKLAPGTVLEPHADFDDIVFGGLDMPKDINNYNQGLMKYHFAIDVPSNGTCGVTAVDEEKIIKNGDLYAFDENQTHSAYNLTDGSRGVLIVSFRKDLL
jgi:aspartyl/asparaginyl beta-hydroxylase (cupin superfamily)